MCGMQQTPNLQHVCVSQSELTTFPDWQARQSSVHRGVQEMSKPYCIYTKHECNMSAADCTAILSQGQLNRALMTGLPRR